MSDNGSQFVKQAQEANRSMAEAMRGLANTQFKVMQQLAGVQREQFNKAVEAARNQMQLIGQKREPHELASTQADLVRQYGQKYVDSVNKAVIIVSEALEEYGEQLKKGKSAATDEVQQAADTATRGSKKAAHSTKSSGKSSK
jgi:predicted nucleic acid-binding protein